MLGHKKETIYIEELIVFFSYFNRSCNGFGRSLEGIY